MCSPSTAADTIPPANPAPSPQKYSPSTLDLYAAAAVKIGGKVGAVLGFLAIVFATINVIGGYMVTDRMLGMFKKKDAKK